MKNMTVHLAKEHARNHIGRCTSYRVKKNEDTVLDGSVVARLSKNGDMVCSAFSIIRNSIYQQQPGSYY
jgi:hypothetical protein